jgi:Leucine-rich repeat (LRR) protein
MAMASGRTGGSKLGRRWGAEVTISLMVGLAFLLCAKTSSYEDTVAMKEFLLKCGTTQGKILQRQMNLTELSTLEINTSQVKSASEVPRNWKILTSLEYLEFTGNEIPETGEDVRAEVSENGAQILEDMLSLAAGAPNLEILCLRNMKIKRLPNGVLATKAATIRFRMFACSEAAIPEKDSLGHIEVLSLETFLCEKDDFLNVLFGMHNLEILRLIKSDIGNIGNLRSVGKDLFLRKLDDLEMREVDKSPVENFIRHVKMESLTSLTITRVPLNKDLAFFEDADLPNLGRISFTSTGIESLQGLKQEKLPLLTGLVLQETSNLKLDENMCKRELRGLKGLVIDIEVCANNVGDIGKKFPNLERCMLSRGQELLMTMRHFAESNKKLTIVLHENIIQVKKEFRNVRPLHEENCTYVDIEVQVQISQEEYTLLMRMLKKCEHLRHLVVRFRQEPRELLNLGFIGRLNDRGAFTSLVSFDMYGLDPFRRMEIFKGEFCKGVRGEWDKTGNKWKLELKEPS